MNTQINLRIPEKLLNSAQNYADNYGYSNVQDFIKETLREKLYEDGELTAAELKVINKLVDISEKNNNYASEEELFEALDK